MKRSVQAVLVAVAIIACAVLACFLWFRQPTLSPVVLPQSFYVWQQSWDPQVSAAVIRSASRSSGYLFLTHVIRVKSGALDADAVMPDYAALSKARVPLTATLRAEVSLAPMLAGKEWEKVERYVSGIVKQVSGAAVIKGATLAGIQLDYDCPTSKLGDYARLLSGLRKDFPALKWSFTALPTWLKSSAFQELADSVDYYVLQVHSLDRPETIREPIVLCDSKNIRPWMRSASRFGVPFLVALPTYGYRVYFDTLGKFAALSAEGDRLSLPPGYQMKQATIDPAEMAGVVRDIQQKPVGQCTGMVWFRLPTEGDRLNWTWPAMAAVMDGREPRVSYTAEVRNPQPGLYEVWVKNTGEAEHPGDIRVHVNNKDAGILAYDLINGYKETKDPASADQVLTGPAPRLDTPMMAAWYRMTDANAVLKVGSVPEVLK